MANYQELHLISLWPFCFFRLCLTFLHTCVPICSPLLTTRPPLLYSEKQTVPFCTEQFWLWQMSYIKRSHLFCDCFVVVICPSLGWQPIHLKFIIYFSNFSKQIDWWPTFMGSLCEVLRLHPHEPKTLQLLWDCHFLIHFCVFTNPPNTLPMFLRRSIILTY